jgi:S1-C subfamily serine protease
MFIANLKSVSGDTPEDTGTGADGPDHGDGSQDHIRGWISPDDRLWRHPSDAAAKAATGNRADVPDRNRPSPWIVGGAAVCVAGALLASGLVLATSGASPDAVGPPPATTASSLAVVTAPPTTEPGSANLAGLTQMNRMAVTVRPSLAALTVTRPSGVSMATGIIAESGGIIATTAAAIAGARSISFDGSDGTRTPAELVGSDPGSGIAVLRVPSDLPVANFDSTDPAPGSTMMAMAMHPGSGSGSAPRSSVYAGAVRSSGTAVGTDTPASAFSVTTADLPLGAHDGGCALLSGQGLVSGLLESTQTDGDTTVGVFLPAELVLGVTRQLVAAGTVERGWLGIEASDIAGTAGATVTGNTLSDAATLDAVDAQGTATQAGLQIGDVIVGVDGGAVHSTAELRTRLYADLPGTSVVVAVDRSGTLGTTTAVLSAYPSSASDAVSSP